MDNNDGWIWKVLLSGREEGKYERLEGDSDGMTILPDTIFAPTNNHLYVLSGRSVIKLKVEHCGTFGLEMRVP